MEQVLQNVCTIYLISNGAGAWLRTPRALGPWAFRILSLALGQGLVVGELLATQYTRST